MQISSQNTQVNHEFERLREREISAHNTNHRFAHSASKHQATLSSTDEEEAYRVTLSPKQEVQKKAIESLSGKEITIFSEQQQRTKLSVDAKNLSSAADIEILSHLETSSSMLSVKESLYEYERMDYSTRLLLEDPNGATTSLSFALSYTRELDIQRHLSLTAAEMKDPLVLNIGQREALFAKDKQKFDLDGDGQKELLPELVSGVWYLAYDRNQNGRIDNGLELFGAQTGQGFTELAELDDNHNSLIESDDLLFSQLSLWDGQQKLQSLTEGGVRAIALNAAHTPFTFTDQLGNASAQIRQTSVFVSHDNRLGAVHQVDIAV